MKSSSRLLTTSADYSTGSPPLSGCHRRSDNMSEDGLFPPYIARPEEDHILQQLAEVQSEGSSRVVLLYGPGGIGKTYLVREMARAEAGGETVVWLPPIDVDDSDFWLLSNVERMVADQMDPESQYFERYRNYLSRLPDYNYPHVGRGAVISHLGRIKRVFVECYTQFVESTGRTVVFVFDTVEALRSTYLLVTLAQWMKALPATLFILSGRPMPSDSDAADPIEYEFASPHQRLPVQVINLREFTYESALRYLNRSGIAGSLTDEEKIKLVYLTRGHPLWLATAIAYLAQRDMPEEASLSLAAIESHLPYDGPVTPEGRSLLEAFKRRLIAPYREVDFWHESDKRLAVLREAVNSRVWQQLMADRSLPPGASTLEEAWSQLMRRPWIRPRANGRYVALHDAMAEELAHRIIPLHDQDQQWRHELWRRAVGIYREMIDELTPRLEAEQAALDEWLRQLDTKVRAEGASRTSGMPEAAFIQDVARFDARKHELDRFKAAFLFYQLLSDFELGCQLFLNLFQEAERRADFNSQELLALEMYRCLPSGIHSYALGDVVGSVIEEFRRWLPSAAPQLYREIGISMAAYLIRNESPEDAFKLLDELPMLGADSKELFRIDVLRGNACMRIPGSVMDSEPYFMAALEKATQFASDGRQRMVAEAQKELGFYFRNKGMWRNADAAYRLARDAISEVLDTNEDREELASIHTNWAYVKGLTGEYRDGSNLVESAISIRHWLGRYYEEGISWSVCGEILRYERRFQKAWDAYSVAEQIFYGERSWTWLGVIYQEQAICLFQAMQDGINLTSERHPLETAKRLITRSLDICRDQAIRSYPSALNRAGRIFGLEDPDGGLAYLADGVDWARRLSDGWFWFANLIEYVELCYRAWVETRMPRYYEGINAREGEIRLAAEEYDFPDLWGRWHLLRGHLDMREWLDAQDERSLDSALINYRDGFALLAQWPVGSSGASILPAAFATFASHFSLLPQTVRTKWQQELRRAWRDVPEGSILLLARLETLL
jgi:tetratricopeptide (TPR) repeat protein